MHSGHLDCPTVARVREAPQLPSICDGCDSVRLFRRKSVLAKRPSRGNTSDDTIGLPHGHRCGSTGGISLGSAMGSVPSNEISRLAFAASQYHQNVITLSFSRSWHFDECTFTDTHTCSELIHQGWNLLIHNLHH